MKRFLKSFRHGQRGFTLIELLVVVGILGILAAVIVPNVSRFLGSGLIESANTEAHNVQTAVVAYMADQSLALYDGGDVGPNNPGSAPEEFLLNPGGLQATYTMGDDGAITDATPLAGGKWQNLVYDQYTGWGSPTLP